MSTLPHGSVPESEPSKSSQNGLKSKFTYKNLSQLSAYGTNCPLRVIAHIDLDAFYAQCEQIRLNLPEDTPLAVQQWEGIIAINYPARAFGLSRFYNIEEAKKICPELVLQHVPTWKEGEKTWSYRPKDAKLDIRTHKVSLDHYRLQSRNILSCIKNSLPANLQKVEKASVDEVFLDLSAHVHSILLQRYPQLGLTPPYDDPTENLPSPPVEALHWSSDAVVDLDDGEAEDKAVDWDDICLLIGSEIVRSVRSEIREKLKYTCSGGIARNKMLSKLGSGHNKPNRQTVIRNRAIRRFLGEFKFTKVRSFGGKLGDHVVAKLGTDSITEMMDVSLEQMKSKLGADTGTWIFYIVRGDETSEVSSRTQIKSMLSAKSFQPTITTFEQGVRWLRIFVADIFSRLVEEGVLEHKRRPRTINLHHRQAGKTRSKQLPIPTGRTVDEETLFDLSKNLLGQIAVDGTAWPCSNLSLSVSGFEDGPTGNRGIGSFLLKGDEAKMVNENRSVDSDSASADEVGPSKRLKTDTGSIQKFFKGRSETEPRTKPDESKQSPSTAVGTLDHEASLGTHVDPDDDHLFLSDDEKHVQKVQPGAFVCSKCDVELPLELKPEHDDWHFAMDLQASENAHESLNNRTSLSKASKKKPEKSAKSTTKKSSGTRLEKGQSTLKFG